MGRRRSVSQPSWATRRSRRARVAAGDGAAARGARGRAVGGGVHATARAAVHRVGGGGEARARAAPLPRRARLRRGHPGTHARARVAHPPRGAVGVGATGHAPARREVAPERRAAVDGARGVVAAARGAAVRGGAAPSGGGSGLSARVHATQGARRAVRTPGSRARPRTATTPCTRRLAHRATFRVSHIGRHRVADIGRHRVADVGRHRVADIGRHRAAGHRACSVGRVDDVGRRGHVGRLMLSSGVPLSSRVAFELEHATRRAATHANARWTGRMRDVYHAARGVRDGATAEAARARRAAVSGSDVPVVGCHGAGARAEHLWWICIAVRPARDAQSP